MRNTLLLFALVVLSVRQGMSAQNHLEPCAILYGEEADYMYWLQETLMKKESEACSTRGKLGILLFHTEYCGEKYLSLSVDGHEVDGEGATLFHSWVDDPLSYALRGYRKNQPSFGSYPEVNVRSAVVEFPSQMARDILVLWRKTLFSTRYARSHEPTLDGADYLFFAVDEENRHLYGKTLGYTSGEMGRVIKIGHLLMSYCKVSEQKRRENILAELKLLIAQDKANADAVTNSMEAHKTLNSTKSHPKVNR